MSLSLFLFYSEERGDGIVPWNIRNISDRRDGSILFDSIRHRGLYLLGGNGIHSTKRVRNGAGAYATQCGLQHKSHACLKWHNQAI